MQPKETTPLQLNGKSSDNMKTNHLSVPLQLTEIEWRVTCKELCAQCTMHTTPHTLSVCMCAFVSDVISTFLLIVPLARFVVVW